MQIQPTASI